MALAVFGELYKCTGTNAGTENNCSKHPCFLSADIHSVVPADYKVAAPQGSGDPANYSYEMFLKWKCTVAPDNYCENFKAWGASHQPDHEQNPANKITIYWGTTETGTTPSSSASTIATTAQHSSYNSSGTALAIPVLTANDRIDAVGEFVGYLVPQMKVVYGAQQGSLPTMTFHLTWEET